MLEEVALLDELLELLAAHKPVMNAVHLAGARRARGARHRVGQVRVKREEALDYRVLAHA
jgi:hypothetical protein